MSADECVRLGTEDNGREVALHTGDALCIDLQESPTTGFRWRLVAVDATVVALDEDRFDVMASQPGASGVRHFRFVAVGPGTTNITLHRTRRWETGAEPDYTLRVTARVSAA